MKRLLAGSAETIFELGLYRECRNMIQVGFSTLGHHKLETVPVGVTDLRLATRCNISSGFSLTLVLSSAPLSEYDWHLHV